MRFLSIMISNLFCYIESFAFFGNTHFNLGKETLKIGISNISEDEVTAFLSGLVYADIGKFKFDDELKIDSDSYIFSETMKRLATTSEEKWFARGFAVHAFQDKNVTQFLKNVFGDEYNSDDYIDYLIKCALLDSYFFKKTNSFISNDFFERSNEKININKPLDISETKLGISKVRLGSSEISNNNNDNDNMYYKKDMLVIYDDLIKRTYHSLGLEVTKDDIYDQAAVILGIFTLATSVINKAEIPNDIVLNIEFQIDNLTRLCKEEFNF